MLSQLKRDLRKKANPAKAKVLQGFFKTGKGQYGEGDVFLGVTVPETRKVAIAYKELSLDDVRKVLMSPIHEERLCALLILVCQFEKGNANTQKKIYDFYWKHASRVNNWDLVDLTAPKIVGAYLLDKKRGVLRTLAQSKNVWEKRIAIVATYAFIREGQFDDCLAISEILLKDNHDLIHKAVGWMLREVGKKDQPVLEQFLDRYCAVMPRTMLRYAIEKFPEGKRKGYLRGEVHAA